MELFILNRNKENLLTVLKKNKKAQAHSKMLSIKCI